MSSEQWAVSTECDEQDCNGVLKYNKSLSRTNAVTGQIFVLHYLLGQLFGSVATETVTLGGISIAQQVVGK